MSSRDLLFRLSFRRWVTVRLWNSVSWSRWKFGSHRSDVVDLSCLTLGGSTVTFCDTRNLTVPCLKVVKGMHLRGWVGRYLSVSSNCWITCLQTEQTQGGYRFGKNGIGFGGMYIIPVCHRHAAQWTTSWGKKWAKVLWNEYHWGTLGAKGVKGGHFHFNILKGVPHKDVRYLQQNCRC